MCQMYPHDRHTHTHTHMTMHQGSKQLPRCQCWLASCPSQTWTSSSWIWVGAEQEGPQPLQQSSAQQEASSGYTQLHHSFAKCVKLSCKENQFTNRAVAFDLCLYVRNSKQHSICTHILEVSVDLLVLTSPQECYVHEARNHEWVDACTDGNKAAFT